MKFKNIPLLLVFFLGSGLNAAESSQVKKAKLSLSHLKRAIKCVHKRQGCTAQERKKIIGYGSAAIAAVLLLGGVGGGAAYALRGRSAAPALPPVAPVQPVSSTPYAVTFKRPVGLTEEQRDQISQRIEQLQRDADRLVLVRFMPMRYTQFTECLQEAAAPSVPLVTSREKLQCANTILQEAQNKKKEVETAITALREKNRGLLQGEIPNEVLTLQTTFADFLTQAEEAGAALATIEAKLRGAQNVLKQMEEEVLASQR